MRSTRLAALLGMALTIPVIAATSLAQVVSGPDLKPHGEIDPDNPGPWKLTTVISANLTQSSFTNNWAGGDKGSFGWIAKLDAKAERQFSHKFNSSNLLQLAYGQTSLQEPDPADPSRRRWRSPEKNSDLILFESVGRFSLHAIVDPYVAFRLDSQFRDESDPAGTFTFNPVKLTETAGVARVVRKTEDSELIGRFGFGFRETHARAFTDATGDQTTSFWASDGGFELQFSSTQPLLAKRVLYQGKALFFYPLFYSKSSDLKEFDRLALAADPQRMPVADFWKTVDINFQNTFTAQITKALGVALYAQLVYDKFDAATNVDPSQPIDAAIREIDGGVRKAVQFKQVLALALIYKVL